MTCESCQWREATRVVHYEAEGDWAATTFVTCELCAPVEFALTESALQLVGPGPRS